MKREVIAKRIKEARERYSLSQQELANLMGWKSHTSLVAIENGKQDIKTWELLKFAKILKISPESLYLEEPIVFDSPVIFWRKEGRKPNCSHARRTEYHSKLPGLPPC